MTAALLVAAGGAVGAPLRYLTDLWVQARHDTVLPWGTLVVNIVGSFALGLTAGAVSTAAVPAWVLTLVGTGLCGALTTFSTFGFETIRLIQSGSKAEALLNVLVSLAAGMLTASLGWWLATALL